MSSSHLDCECLDWVVCDRLLFVAGPIAPREALLYLLTLHETLFMWSHHWVMCCVSLSSMEGPLSGWTARDILCFTFLSTLDNPRAISLVAYTFPSPFFTCGLICFQHSDRTILIALGLIF